MIHATADVSVPLELRMVKLVPALRALTCNHPGVPPGVLHIRKMREFAVIFVVLTTTVPPTSVATPIVAFVPSFTPSPYPTVPM